MEPGHKQVTPEMIEGGIALINNVPFLIHDFEEEEENKTIEYENCDTGGTNKYLIPAGSEGTAKLRALTIEGRAMVMNAVVSTGGFIPHSNEKQLSATAAYTLDNVPVKEGSLYVFQRRGNLEKTSIVKSLINISGTPAADEEFSYDATTGDVTLNSGLADNTVFYNDYLEASTTEGKKLVYSFGSDDEVHELIIRGGYFDVRLNKHIADGFSIVYPEVNVITKPKRGLMVGDIKELEVKFNIISPPIESFK